MQGVLIDVRDDITMKVKIINLSQYSSISEVSIESYNIITLFFIFWFNSNYVPSTKR